MRTLFRRLDKRKASGPDNRSSSTLRNCAHQLCTVFIDIFKSSIEQRGVPVCFQTSMIIPIPKKSNVSTMNEYSHVTLMSIGGQYLIFISTGLEFLHYQHLFTRYVIVEVYRFSHPSFLVGHIALHLIKLSKKDASEAPT